MVRISGEVIDYKMPVSLSTEIRSQTFPYLTRMLQFIITNEHTSSFKAPVIVIGF